MNELEIKIIEINGRIIKRQVIKISKVIKTKTSSPLIKSYAEIKMPKMLTVIRKMARLMLKRT